jgi:hypothetical protein
MMILVLLLAFQVNGLYFTLMGKTEQCFGLSLAPPKSWFIYYVISGKTEDTVTVRVTSPSGHIVWTSPHKAKEGEAT